MPEPMQPHEEALLNPETHHEKSDVNVRALLWFVVVFVIFAALSHLGVWLLYRYFRSVERHVTTPPLSAVARPAGAEIPATPRLQPFPATGPEGQVQPPYTATPAMDVKEMRAAEDQALRNPGWIDKQKGIVRLPIEDAKRLVVQQGLPVTGNPQ